ncbi:MAG TPA: hypothetical protein PLQ32_04205 [Flavihumibacter sp.]|nr:hypothetical protein [Bacteroidota bacterium]HPZ87283.1 hypothetical protein [Flavihumibacter sp.]HQD10898.1 hypothetical protein [Flavihumibacter sp.]
MKEHSVEGLTIPALDSLPDSSQVEPTPSADSSLVNNLLGGCYSCQPQAALADSSWLIPAGTRWQCGSLTGAVINIERDALTFFGPSACSQDSGLIINAYFKSQPLNQSRLGVRADWASAVYYDNISGQYVFVSKPENKFSLVANYNHETRELIGEWSGEAVYATGAVGKIRGARFRCQLK